MSILTRSATLPYATTDAATLIAMARRLLLDPLEVGPIRLVGVGFSGLSEVRQESLFPDLELMAEEVSDTGLPQTVSQAAERAPAWRIGDDVVHTEYGHGWVQGAGHGVMTVRFETRSTGKGQGACASWPNNSATGSSASMPCTLGSIACCRPSWPEWPRSAVRSESAETVPR